MLNILEKKYRSSIIVAVFLQCLSACSDKEEVPATSETKPAVLPLVQQVRDSYRQLNNYAAVVYSQEISSDRSQERLVRSFFSEPWLMRNEIIAGTEPADAGSEAIYDGGDKITGHKGGMLGFATVSLYYDSPMITTLLGFTFREMAMEAMLERLSVYGEHGIIEVGEEIKTRLGAATTLHLRLRENASLPLKDRVGAVGGTHEEIYIDKNRMLPVGWIIYKDESRIRTSIFEALVTDAELEPDIFHQVRLSKQQYAALDKLLPARDWRPDYWQASAAATGSGL